MQQITSLFARKAINAADASVDKSAALRSIGIDPESPIDPSHMIPATEYYALVERLMKVDANGTSLPLRVGASMCCDDYGAFGLAWKTAINLRGSYERAERYGRVLTSVSTHEVEPADGGAYMNLHRVPVDRAGMRLSNEMTIASVFSLSKQVSTVRFEPIAVYFQHPAPKNIEHHEDYFGCSVHFDSQRDALLVSEEILQTANKLGDDSVSRFFDVHLSAKIAEFSNDTSLEHQVRNQISRSLSEGIPLISEVAVHFGMSGRTLQRKLAEGGNSFKSLVDESRRQLAERLLKQTDYSLAEVAFMTGFAEQSSFTRAFKRWQGQSPRSFRITAQF
tara:strand:+ start:19517 stop:20521 length:1005 start_codon:yes stop_codon:yes gene_type:complete